MRVNNSVQTRNLNRDSYRLNDLGGGHCYAIHTKDKAVTVIHLPAGLQLNFDGDPPQSRPSPDGGWGWLVAAGTTLTVAFVPSLLLCSGILLAEVCKEWHETNLFAASWIPAIMYSMWNFAGPISTVLLSVYSCRVVTLIGGIVLSLGLISSFFVKRLEVFYITYGILGGIGAGLSLFPGPVLLSHYFGKHRGAANVVCLVGGSALQLGMPPLIYALLHRYLFRGTVLILGALAMHMLVAAMLYRPRGKDTRGLRPIPPRYKSLSRSAKKKTNKKKKKKRRRKPSGSEDSDQHSWLNPSENIIIPPRRRTRTISTDSFRMLPDIPEEQEPIAEEAEEAEDEERGGYNGDVTSATRPLQEHDANARFRCASTVSLPQQPVMNAPLRTKQRSYSLNALGLTPSTKSYEEDDELHATAIGIFGNPLDALSTNRPNSILLNAKNLLWTEPIQLLSDPLWLILSLSIAVFMLVFPNVLLYLPLRALHLGLKPKHVAALLSFGVLADLGGRVFMPWLSKKWKLKPKALYGIMEIISTVTLFGFANNEATFFLLAICCIIFGLASGACVVVVSPMVYEYLGAEKLPAALMFSRMLQGILFLAVAPLIGLYASNIGVRNVFHLLMTLQLCSIVFWNIHLVAKHCLKNIKKGHIEVPVTEL